MRYYANPSTPRIREAMTAGKLGCIMTPRQGQSVPGAAYCADNGCYGDGYPGDDAWWKWLTSIPDRHLCAFAVAPDVVGDAAATLKRSAPWLPRIRELGVPAALVAQNGLEDLTIPWDTFDVLFIGGDTEWKLSQHARDIVRQARDHGKPAHLGRCNSSKRLRYADAIGCDSADGTYLVFGPDQNLPKLLRWLDDVHSQGSLC